MATKNSAGDKDRMHHRGPDSEGYLVDDGVALGCAVGHHRSAHRDQPTFNQIAVSP
jgi:asparagine synthetase B (glutamine-hydrolysing)